MLILISQILIGDRVVGSGLTFCFCSAHNDQGFMLGDLITAVCPNPDIKMIELWHSPCSAGKYVLPIDT